MMDIPPKGLDFPRQGSLTFRVVSLAVLLFVLNAGAESSSEFFLAPIDFPVIKDKKIFYTVCLVTDDCPKDLWWYFDQSGKHLIIEFYDRSCSLRDSIVIEGTLPVKGIEVRNLQTQLVLSGKKTQIHLLLQEEMHCDARCTGDTLKVILWKALVPKIEEEKKKNPILIPLSVIVGCATLTVGILGIIF